MEGARRVREGRLAAVWSVMSALRAPAAGLQWGAGRPRRGWWQPAEELRRGRGVLGQRSTSKCAWKGGQSWPSRGDGLRVLG